MESDSGNVNKIVAVDFDGTLITVDSTKEYYRFKSKNRMSFMWSYYGRFMFSYLLCLYSKDYMPLKRKRISWVRYKFDNSIMPNFQTNLHSYLNQDVLSIIERYSESGAKVVVVSAGIKELLEDFCVRLGFELLAYSMNEPLTKDLNFEVKIKEISNHYNDNCLLAAFGNSEGDVPMLKVAKNSYWVSESGIVTKVDI